MDLQTLASRWFTYLVLAALLTIPCLGALPAWTYDPGPDVRDPMQKELIDLHAAIPDFGTVSEQLAGSQEFRGIYGPVLWRMPLGKNKIKILFMGQDATHIAEAAARTATAGFGGRAQDLARHFGVSEGAGFINAFAFTIKWQYGVHQAPMLQFGKLGFGQFVDAGFWLLTHDPLSPVADWRNKFIDWILRQNADSLKLIVLFGGTARDVTATFIESRGGKVGTFRSEKQASNYRIPEMVRFPGGSNTQFAVPANKDGEDLAAELLGKESLKYTTSGNSADLANQKAAKEVLQEKFDEAVEKMVFTDGGPYQNGLLHSGQIGGYDIDKNMVIKEEDGPTISIRDLELSDGRKIKNDILVVQFPHPTVLSNMERENPGSASDVMEKELAPFIPYRDEKGWEIEPDLGWQNEQPKSQRKESPFARGERYTYSRTDIGPEFYDFGAPGIRMVPVSLATRLSGHPHVISFGSSARPVVVRDRKSPKYETNTYDLQRIADITGTKPAEEFPKSELYTSRPRGLKWRYVFDPGPGEELAQTMKENLDLEAIFKPKRGKTWKKDGIAAFNTKTHPDVRDFGHYRGTFTKPRVIILADPDGVDDLITARALTGERGQYLQSLLSSFGVTTKYLVVKTVPFGMDGANEDEWKVVLQQTATYRKAIFEKVLDQEDYVPELILADGEYAGREISALVKGRKIPTITIERGKSKKAGLAAAAELIAELDGFEKANFNGKRANIPRRHLSYYARMWEGTSGDTVIDAQDKNRGLSFAEIAPRWAWEDMLPLLPQQQKNVDTLRRRLEENKLRVPNEPIPDLIERLGLDVSALHRYFAIDEEYAIAS